MPDAGGKVRSTPQHELDSMVTGMAFRARDGKFATGVAFNSRRGWGLSASLCEDVDEATSSNNVGRPGNTLEPCKEPQGCTS